MWTLNARKEILPSINMTKCTHLISKYRGEIFMFLCSQVSILDIPNYIFSEYCQPPTLKIESLPSKSDLAIRTLPTLISAV
jgi:hypothetical protein